MSTKKLALRIIRPLLRRLGKFEYIRFGLRFNIVRFFNNPQESCNEPFEANFFGLRWRGNMNNLIDCHVFYFGAYAREELSLIKNVITSMNQPVMLDCGANIGQHTLFGAKYAKLVIAIEPFGMVAGRIFQKVGDNNLKI